MNIARQATENMEYLRRLLEEKQAGFAASVELAVSVIRRQIERPEETMELTLRPGRHEIIERQDLVHEWRVARLARLGIPWPSASPKQAPNYSTQCRRVLIASGSQSKPTGRAWLAGVWVARR